MSGPGAYCNSLWLAALRCQAAFAASQGDKAEAATCQDLLGKAAKAFKDKLWTGTHFRFDATDKGEKVEFHKSIENKSKT